MAERHVALKRFERFLRRCGRTDIAAHLPALAADLANEERAAAATSELNQLAQRWIGVSFTDLCRTRTRASLTGVFAAFSGVLVIAIAFAMVTSKVLRAAERDLLMETRRALQSIDERIGAQAESRFYASPTTPCREKTVNLVRLGHNLRIELGLPAERQPMDRCNWAYRDLGLNEVIVRDHWWSSPGFRLERREYFRSGALVASDEFDGGAPKGGECFRRRTYRAPGLAGVVECYAESGHLTSVTSGSNGHWWSAIPPMAYWFFYR